VLAGPLALAREVVLVSAGGGSFASSVLVPGGASSSGFDSRGLVIVYRSVSTPLVGCCGGNDYYGGLLATGIPRLYTGRMSNASSLPPLSYLLTIALTAGRIMVLNAFAGAFRTRSTPTLANASRTSRRNYITTSVS
jgi:hypothetical protein